jgi:F-type H+-transporting ATPase subunit epsilon
MASTSVLRVEVVSPERRVWSGEAASVSARTLDGDIGILVDHAPLLGVLVPGVVTIKGTDGSKTDFDMSGGFISVNKNRVSILGEESE